MNKTTNTYNLLNTAALLYFQNTKAEGRTDFESFTQVRNMSPEIVDIYRLGIATDKNTIVDWLSGIKTLDEKNAFFEIAIEFGLIRNTSKGLVDSFKNRIMFPIMDDHNQATGFTSRSIQNDYLPRYMNTRSSLVFDRANCLYGINNAINAIKEKDAVIIVEGNMDQIILTSHGFQNTVALMGTHLGGNALTLLQGLTKNFYIALDSDQAGISAVRRINRQLAEARIIAKFIDFFPLRDPDEFLKLNGPLAFQDKLNNAKVAFYYLLQKLIPETIPENIDEKLAILDRAYELLMPIEWCCNGEGIAIWFARELGLKSHKVDIIKSYYNYYTQHIRKR
jgi:DNA primase